ncbi:MAG: MotA/TolQ/ExbB proton channel family protein [Nitrospirae bacterium]|nr:MotA/TolQ/ExbB proton channel family protein [Nitrospirota bacterium]
MTEDEMFKVGVDVTFKIIIYILKASHMFSDNFLTFITPENTIALNIIYILTSIFAVWFLFLVFKSVILVRTSRVFSKLSNINFLLIALENYEADKKRQEHVQVNQFKNEALNEYIKKMSLPKKHIAVSHLSSIFSAGLKDTYFDINSQLTYVIHKIFGSNSIFKAVLGTFIIIGLLGTLFGLADSLSKMNFDFDGHSSIESKNSDKAQNMKHELQDFLSKLKSAFAPSIWGVALTIVAMFFYLIYIRIICNPLRSKIEFITLNVLIPELYPTPSQKFTQALQVSYKELSGHFDSARQVADMANNMKGDVRTMTTNLGVANTALKSLVPAVDKINKASDKINDQFANNLINFSKTFGDSVNALTSFQGELKVLYSQLLSESSTFQTNVKDTLKIQHTEISEILNTLRTYEKSYLDDRAKIEEGMKEYITLAVNINEKIDNYNANYTSSSMEKISSGLNNVKDSVHSKLNELVTRFNTFEVPMQQAATKMSGSFENFFKQMNLLFDEMRKEYSKEIQANAAQTLESNELKMKVAALFEKLSTSWDSQISRIEGLYTHMTTLSKEISSLGLNITSLSSGAQSFASYMGEMGETMQIFKKAPEIFNDFYKDLVPVADIVSEFTTMVKEIKKSVKSFDEILQTINSTEFTPPSYNELTDNVKGLSASINGYTNTMYSFIDEFKNLTMNLRNISIFTPQQNDTSIAESILMRKRVF